MGNAESKGGSSPSSKEPPPPPPPHPQRMQKSPPRVSTRKAVRKKPSLPTESWVTSPKPVAHTRALSINAHHPHRPPHAVDDLALSPRSAYAAISAMGQTDSKVRPPSRANTLPHHPSPPRHATPQPPLATDAEAEAAAAAAAEAPPAPEESGGSAESPSQSQPAESQPVDVPPANHVGVNDAVQDDYIPTGYAESPYGLPPANYSRPPRLPLPIEEEVHTPGSPIITPQDVTAIKEDDIEGGAIPRIASVRSSTTVDDDDVGDNDAYDTSNLNSGSVKVPLKLAWNGSGEKVFVTGTFCNWEKKIKLPRNKDGSHGFSANVYLPPGTHHVKFLVDGEMITSPELPTTVDWTNILVNYVEVVAPLPEETKGKPQPPEPAKPIDIPGTALTVGQTTGTDEVAARPRADQTRPADTDAELSPTLQATDGSTKSDQRPAEASASIPIPSTSAPRPTATEHVRETEAKPEAKPTLPRAKYTSAIPDFLVDLDNYNNPEDERYQRAQKVINTLPQPPSLPMFLNKSILNGATPHKDDASVLIMPNHTVLNHLATSSIKSGVLATSGTTRYKRKFLTTIMYKPTSEDT